MDSVWDYVLNRLTEQSTFRGIVWLLVSLGLIPAEASDMAQAYLLDILRAGTAVIGLISVCFPDRNCFLVDWIKKRRHG